MIVFLYSCTTAPQRYPTNAMPSGRNKKLAYLEYEMARNIILHKDYTRLPEAFKHLKNARTLLDNDPRIYYMTALAYRMRNDKEKYVAYLNEAIKKDKNFFDAYNALGIYYYEKKEYKKALETFSKLITNPLYPHGDVAFFNRSRVYIKLKELKKAQNDMNSALMFSGYRNKTYWENLILLQLEQKEYKKALGNIQKMALASGETDYTHYIRALCYSKLGMPSKAKKELKYIKDDNPDYFVLKKELLNSINDNKPHN